MSVTLLSSETKTAQSGLITVPTGCVMVVALVKGSTNAVTLNGYPMTVKASVASAGNVPAISAQTYRSPIVEQQPYTMTGDWVVFYYLTGAVNARPIPVQVYDDTGDYTIDLTTATDELIFGAVAGTADSTDGQVTITGDTVAFTLAKDETLYRAGYLTPADASVTLLCESPGTLTSYWYQPPRIWHEGKLISEEWVEVTSYWVDGYYMPPENDKPGYWVPGYKVYDSIVHPAEYSDGYWEYPPLQWVTSGAAGKLSVVAIVMTDKQLGSSYVSRPIPF